MAANESTECCALEYSLSWSGQARPGQPPTMLFWVSHYSRLKQISLSTWFVGLGLAKVKLGPLEPEPKPDNYIW